MTIAERHKLLQSSIETVVRSGNFDDLSKEILNRVIIEAIRTYTQRLNVGVQDSVASLVDDFKYKITRAVFESANTWRVNHREPVIFPLNCRFLYQRGESTLAIIEHSPQVRSLSFQAKMLGERVGIRHEVERVALALPYIVFVVHFRRQGSIDQFSNLYCAWRNAPLAGLDDVLCRPVLPNIHENLSVCTGSLTVPNGTFAERVHTIIAHFWNSVFSGDLADYWWRKGSIDSRLRSTKVWEAKSVENSLFILECQFSQQGSVKDLINLLTSQEEAPDETQLRHRLTDSIEGCVENLFSKLLTYFKKTPSERHYPKDVTDSVTRALEACTKEMVDLVALLLQESRKLSDEFAQISGTEYNWKKRGNFWEM